MFQIHKIFLLSLISLMFSLVRFFNSMKQTIYIIQNFINFFHAIKISFSSFSSIFWYFTLIFANKRPHVSTNGPQTALNPTIQQVRTKTELILWARRHGPKHQICYKKNMMFSYHNNYHMTLTNWTRSIKIIKIPEMKDMQNGFLHKMQDMVHKSLINISSSHS